MERKNATMDLNQKELTLLFNALVEQRENFYNTAAGLSAIPEAKKLVEDTCKEITDLITRITGEMEEE